MLSLINSDDLYQLTSVYNVVGRGSRVYEPVPIVTDRILCMEFYRISRTEFVWMEVRQGHKEPCCTRDTAYADPSSKGRHTEGWKIMSPILKYFIQSKNSASAMTGKRAEAENC